MTLFLSIYILYIYNISIYNISIYIIYIYIPLSCPWFSDISDTQQNKQENQEREDLIVILLISTPEKVTIKSQGKGKGHLLEGAERWQKL